MFSGNVSTTPPTPPENGAIVFNLDKIGFRENNEHDSHSDLGLFSGAWPINASLLDLGLYLASQP